MRFTACYIVKNEEQTLPVSIESLRGICDEIIVADTGSTDGTIETAKALGAKVVEFPWCNDFAKARNFALSHATGDIILFLDADERFVPALTKTHATILQKAVEAGEFAFNVKLVNEGQTGNIKAMYLLRIFKNNMGIAYVNPVHEQLNRLDKQYYLPDNFMIYHSGYAERSDEKTNRNLALLKAQLDENGKAADPITYFYLARESTALGERGDAASYIRAFFRESEGIPLQIHLLLAAQYFRMRISLFDASDQFTDSERAQYVDSYMNLAPNHPVAHQMKALYEYEFTGRYATVLYELEEMERLDAAYDERQFPSDITSTDQEFYRTQQCRAGIAMQRGDTAGAFEALLPLLKNRLNGRTASILLHCLNSQPSADCIAFLNSLIDMDNEATLLRLLNSLVHFPERQDLYLYYAKKLLALTRENSDITAIASILLGNAAQAAEIARVLEEAEQRESLLCTAAFIANNPELAQGCVLSVSAKRLLDAYFTGHAIGHMDLEGWVLLAGIYRRMLFINDGAALARLHGLLAQEPFMRFMLCSSYHTVAMRHEAILDCFDLDADYVQALTPLHLAYTYIRLGRAYASLFRFDEALVQYEAILKRNGNLRAVERDLNVIASLSQEHAAKAKMLISQYQHVTPHDYLSGEEESRRFLRLRAMFAAPEQGRLRLVL